MKIKNFKNLKHKEILLTSMIGMTWGFIATLVVGTIVGFLAIKQNNDWSRLINQIKNILMFLTPFAIGVGIGYKAKLKPLQMIALMFAAGIASHSLFVPRYDNGIIWKPHLGFEVLSLDQNKWPLKVWPPGDVFGAWITSVLMLYIFKIFSWDFMLDILILPLFGLFIGLFFSVWLTYITSTLTVLLEWIIENSANKVHWAGILLAPLIGIIMGLALSLPTSSAAIAVVVRLHGDAATAAMAATAAQMISFGVLTYISTKSYSKSFAVAFGTSMLQMQNFSKKPIILLIPTICSGLMALLATVMVSMEFESPRPTSGMGTSSLYGPIFTLEENGWSSWKAWLHVLLFQLFLPFGLTWIIGSYTMNKKQWIKKEWLTI